MSTIDRIIVAGEEAYHALVAMDECKFSAASRGFMEWSLPNPFCHALVEGGELIENGTAVTTSSEYPSLKYFVGLVSVLTHDNISRFRRVIENAEGAVEMYVGKNIILEAKDFGGYTLLRMRAK